MEDIQAALARAHVAIDRAQALTAEVRTLRAAAEAQQRHAELLLDLAELEAAHPLQPANIGSSLPGAANGTAVEALAAAAAAGHVAALSQAASAARQHAVVHGGGEAAGALPAAGDGAAAAVGLAAVAAQQRQAAGLKGLLQLRQRQLRLRSCQLRALRCLLVAEPQLGDFPIQVN